MVPGPSGGERGLNEYPIFVPHRGEHVAAVVTVPERDLLGLTLLVTGVGAGRGHRHRLWTRAARRLADARLASVRMEYLGVGDSSGEVPHWQRSAHGPQLEQAAAVAEAAMRGLGLGRFSVVGNCFGALVAVDLMAAHEACSGALCFLPLIDEGGIQNVRRRARRWGVASRLGRSRMGRRLVVRPAQRLAGRLDRSLAASARTALARGPLLFVYGREDETFANGVRAGMHRALAGTPAAHRERFGFRVLDVPLTQFDAPAGQEAALGTIEGFVVECLQETRA